MFTKYVNKDKVNTHSSIMTYTAWLGGGGAKPLRNLQQSLPYPRIFLA